MTDRTVVRPPPSEADRDIVLADDAARGTESALLQHIRHERRH
jgi:hypothetical protein